MPPNDGGSQPAAPDTRVPTAGSTALVTLERANTPSSQPAAPPIAPLSPASFARALLTPVTFSPPASPTHSEGSVLPATPPRLPTGAKSHEVYLRAIRVRGESPSQPPSPDEGTRGLQRGRSHSYRLPSPRIAGSGSSEQSLSDAPRPDDFDAMFVSPDPPAKEPGRPEEIHSSPEDTVAHHDGHTPNAGRHEVDEVQECRPFNLVTARMDENGRGIHETPQRKVIPLGDQFLGDISPQPVVEMADLTPPSPIPSHRFDVGLGHHDPSPFPFRPDNREQWAASEVEIPGRQYWRPGVRRPNRFLEPLSLQPQTVDPTAPVDPSQRPDVPPRRSARSTSRRPSTLEPQHEGDPFETEDGHLPHESDISDEDEFVPDDKHISDAASPSPTVKPKGKAKMPNDEPLSDGSASEPASRSRTARPKAKGKAGSRNASAGPSDALRGRPSTVVNREIERVGHRMQRELVELAEQAGISYDTLLRKVGFSQQGVREPTLGNVFRKVHKHRLLATQQGLYNSTALERS